MTTVAIHWTFCVSGDGDLSELGDAITDALIAQETPGSGLLDNAVSVDRGRGVLEVEVTAEGAAQHEAIEAGQRAVETALRVAGGRLVPTTLSTTPLARAV